MRWRISKNILVSYERFFLFSLRFFVGFLSFEYCLHCFISAWAIITTLTIFLCVIVEILVNIPNQLPIGCFRKNKISIQNAFYKVFCTHFLHTSFFSLQKIGASYIEWCNFTLCKNHLAKWKQRKSLIRFYNWNLLKWLN